MNNLKRLREVEGRLSETARQTLINGFLGALAAEVPDDVWESCLQTATTITEMTTPGPSLWKEVA